MRTARARNWRIDDTCSVLRVQRIVRSDGVPYRREDSGNAIPDSSRFAPLGEALVRYPWRWLDFAWDKPHRRRWGRNRRSQKVRARNTRRETQRSYTGNRKGAGELSFFDRNSGRTEKEKRSEERRV